MSILVFILAPILLGFYWLIRYQVRLSRVRYLVDTYGLDHKKLQKLKYNDIIRLRHSIDVLRHANDPFNLEALVRPYRN